jgi:cold shock CspA family protein
MTGRIKKLVSERGFGFIEADGIDMFFHIKGVSRGTFFNQLAVGDEVSFDSEFDNQKGKYRAVNVRAL